MRVNVVTVESGWILQKIAERIVEAGNRQDLTTRMFGDGTIKARFRWSLSHTPRVDCVANYYVDIQNCYRGKTSVLDIGYFTHLHENNIKYIQPNWLSLDFIVHGCTRYQSIFEKLYPAEKMDVLIPGEIPDGFDLKKPTIGIFQRGKYEGKGFHFMQEAGQKIQHTLGGFKWRFIGNDWEPVVKQYNDLGIEAVSLGDVGLKYPEGYAAQYDLVDYVLIPSLWESGPMSLIEANAKGIPIISSDVGQSAVDINVDYLFRPGNHLQLRDILHGILAIRLHARQRVSHLSYEWYTRELAKIICKIKKVELR